MSQGVYKSATDFQDFNFAAERLTRKEAAAYIGMTAHFLEADAIRKKHRIPFVRVGDRVFYLKSDLNRWLLSRRVVPSLQGLEDRAPLGE